MKPEFVTLREDDRLGYWLQEPPVAEERPPILVAVHGISRNAAEHAEAFSAVAARHGAVLLAPLFPKDLFPDYQRLGRRGRGLRADLALEAMLSDVRHRLGIDTRRIHLFGFSGGAQFAHRYALAYPERIASLMLAAAGWYTLPDPALPFPRGLAPCERLPDLRFSLPAFLRIPVTVLVGELDRLRDEALNQSRLVDRRLGTNRFERGRRWLTLLESSAEKLGIRARLRFVALPASDHEFAHCIAPDRGDLPSRLEDCLAFAASPSLAA